MPLPDRVLGGYKADARNDGGPTLSDDQIFGVVASAALLVWLVGRGSARDPRRRRQMELAALGLVGAALLYAAFLTAAHFSG